MSATALDKHYPVTHGDYVRAGEASADIKRALRQLGVSMEILRRVSVAAYEAEMNMVIHSLGGEMRLLVEADRVRLVTQDVGPGIADIARAMSEGFSTANEEAQSMGFGAGMGLPNIKRNADEFDIQSKPGQGTRIEAVFHLNKS
mgnify:FL=1